MRALPVAAGTNEDGHYLVIFLHLVLVFVLTTVIKCVVGCYSFA